MHLLEKVIIGVADLALGGPDLTFRTDRKEGQSIVFSRRVKRPAGCLLGSYVCVTLPKYNILIILRYCMFVIKTRG